MFIAMGKRSCHYADYEHLVNICKKMKKYLKNLLDNKHVSKYFQTATALKHRYAKLKLYTHYRLIF